MKTPWQYVVGMLPHRVVAYEDPARKGVLYLRWRVAGDWKRKSLGFAFTRDRKGRIPRDQEQRAREAAEAQFQRLVTGGVIAAAPQAPLTIAEGWALATDPERGKWTKDTPHRKEMARAIERAKSTWGASATWNSIDRGELRRLWRTELKRLRAKGHDGVRATEIVMTRILTIADWLRDEGKIAPTACVKWKGMKDDMAEDFGEYEPKRLRYSLEEYRAMLAASWSVDERFGLLLTIGAEYRLGQVKRVRRSGVDLVNNTVRVPGRGRKRGATIELTPEQLRMLRRTLDTGYLAGLEAARTSGFIVDYNLFPGFTLPVRDGKLVTRAEHAERTYLDNTALRTWLLETEDRARVNNEPIPHIEGRGWYGLRRVAVDAAKAERISREGLRASGGWADSQVPDSIYAEQEQAYARAEAAKVRARIRGEIPEETEQNGASPADEGEAGDTNEDANG